MITIENLISDNKDNHLVVVISFYDNIDKTNIFQIPEEFKNIEIADINIRKLDLNIPIGLSAFLQLSNWILKQFLLFPNAIFTYICSTQTLHTRHSDIPSEKFRWLLFETLHNRMKTALECHHINCKDIIVGPEGYETYAKIYYRNRHAPLVHIVTDTLLNKYNEL